MGFLLFMSIRAPIDANHHKGLIVSDSLGDPLVLTGVDLTNANPLHVAIVDATGDQISSFGGGTQYTEDAAAAANPVGTAVNLIRTDTPAAQVSTDGDNVAQRGTNYGAAYTQIVTSAGAYVDTFGGGTQYTEGDVDATITGTAIMVEGAGNTLVAAPGTAADGQLVNLGTNNDVTVTGTVTEANSAALLTSSQLLDDTVATLGTTTYTEATTKGNVIGAVRRDANTSLVDTTNEVAPLQVNATGELKVAQIQALPTGANVIGALTANQSINVAQINGVTTQMGVGASGTGTQRVVTATDSTIGTVTSVTQNADIRQATASNLNAQVVGTVAHDGVDAGNPVKIGGKARQTNPAAVADLDRVDATYDDLGRQVVILSQVRDLEIHATTTITASTAETTILAAAAAGVFHDVTMLTIANTSATATRVDIRDTTAGTVIWSPYIPAGQMIGANITVPLKQTTAATNWTATCITSLTDLRIFIQAVKNV